MRVLPALAASVLAHVVILGVWRAAAPGPKAQVRAPPAPAVELVQIPPEITPVEVIVLPGVEVDDRGGRASTVATTSPSPSPSPSMSTTTTTSPSTFASTEIDDGPRKLRMRFPKKTHVAMLPYSTLREIAERPGVPLPEQPPAPSGKLHPAGGGEMIAEDLVTPMRIDRDGRAHFDGRSDNEIHVEVPTSRRALGELIDDWYKDPYAQLDHPPVAELPAHEQAVPGGWDSGVRQGSIAKEAGENGIVPIVGGGFDLTAWAMRQAGSDPYQARKQKLLEQTYEERAQMRAVHDSDQRDRSAELMRNNLARLWAAITDPGERRLALFELWDECEEGTGAAGVAGQRARRQVLGWIRSRLPAGSTDAYSVDEITRLNADRQSAQVFAP